MTLKIEKDSTGPSTTIRLIGRMRREHLEELKAQIKNGGSRVTLDLDEVSLVDVDVVCFSGIARERELNSFTVQLISAIGLQENGKAKVGSIRLHGVQRKFAEGSTKSIGGIAMTDLLTTVCWFSLKWRGGVSVSEDSALSGRGFSRHEGLSSDACLLR